MEGTRSVQSKFIILCITFRILLLHLWWYKYLLAPEMLFSCHQSLNFPCSVEGCTGLNMGIFTHLFSFPSPEEGSKLVGAIILASQQILQWTRATSIPCFQVPQFLLEAGFGCKEYRERSGLIGVTQPRRVAAIASAQRVANELGTQLGSLVGYQVAYTQPSSAIQLLLATKRPNKASVHPSHGWGSFLLLNTSQFPLLSAILQRMSRV